MKKARIARPAKALKIPKGFVNRFKSKGDAVAARSRLGGSRHTAVILKVQKGAGFGQRTAPGQTSDDHWKIQPRNEKGEWK